MIRSPFLVVHDFISPLLCEKLIEEHGVKAPTIADDGTPMKHEKFIDGPSRSLIHSSLQSIVGDIEERFDSVVKDCTIPLFQQWFEDPSVVCQGHSCENSKYKAKKWVKVRDVDLVGYLWLKDFNSGVPLDPRFETYGGKLEFPAYDFSLVSQRGTLVLFPAGPHFITAISPVLVGSLEQVKVCIKMQTPENLPWFYNPTKFPGTYQEWFTKEV